MSEKRQHIKREIRLNGQHVRRKYNAEIFTTIGVEDEIFTTKMAMYFTVIFLEAKDGRLLYTMQTNKRFFLDDINFKIKTLTKAQELALKVASLNDTLLFGVDTHFKHLEVRNTEEILKKWEKMKVELQAEFLDMEDLIKDFDWQLKNNIQQLFLKDNFYNFFFANIFYHEFKGEKLVAENKIISNAIGTLDIPIIEQKTIGKKDIVFSDITINLTAKLDVKNKEFSLEKLNLFLGDFAEVGTQFDLEFDYKGSYQVVPPKGLITSGTLTYDFKIGDVYKKTTNINFNLIPDEQ